MHRAFGLYISGRTGPMGTRRGKSYLEKRSLYSFYCHYPTVYFPLIREKAGADSMSSYVLITVVDVGLAEALRIPSIDGHYYILYIFDSMFSQISEFSILAVMVWTVHIMLFGDFQSYGASGAIRDLTTLGFVIVGMLSTISWVLHTAILGSFIRNIPFSPTRVNSQTGIEVAYVAAFAISSILLFIMAGFVVARERSTVRTTFP